MLHHTLYGFEKSDHSTVLVFLNGMTQSTAHWKSHGRYFSQRFRVVTYDAQGQGDSAVTADPLTLKVHAKDLLELLEGLDVERATLIGFSHGARVALQFAASFPDRCDGLVICSASSTATATARAIVRSWAEVLKRGGLEAMSWAALPMILGPDYIEENERMISGIVRASVERNDAHGVAALLDAMTDTPDLSDIADSVDVRSLVMFGEKDPLVSEAGAEDLARRLNCAVVKIERSGHTIPIEQPDRFRELVDGFLDNE